jgi:3-oxoadipate enol-lactonase
MGQAVVSGQTIRFEERGSGVPLVLVHGFPLDRRIWDEQVKELSGVCRVIAVDLPGFGESKGEKAFSIKSMAEAVHGLLGQIKALPCVFAGLSMGGYIALAFAKEFPADLKGLVLVDTRSEADTTEAKQNRDKMIESVRKGGAKAAADAMEPKMVSGETPKNRPEVARKLREIMEACPAKTIEHALVALRDRPDYRDTLASISVPTQIIVGQDDAITPPAMSLAMNKEIRHSKLCVVSNAGHMSPMENPQEVNEAIKGFVKGIR